LADDETKEGDKDTTTDAAKNDRRDIDSVVSEIVSKYGSERAALRVLADQQLDYRREIRDAKGKLPKAGEVVLSADDAKTWEAFRALGKTPKQIGESIAAVDALTTENTSLKVEKVIAEAAGLVNYKPSVLTELAKLKGFRVEVREDGKGDEKKKVAYAVKGEGDEAEESELTAFAADSLADFLPALAAEPTGNGKTITASSSAPLPPQPPRGTAPAPKVKDVAALVAEKRATGAYSQI